MEDVTAAVLKGCENIQDPAERNRLLESNIAAISAER
jgi:hypothetical protein